jgi:predicted nuclease of predicted toxin-antitoxin system
VSSADTGRFYLDEDVPVSAAQIARGMGLDVVAAAEVGARARSDMEQLALAAAESRMVVTYNRDDFIEVTTQALAAGRPHAGVLVVVSTVPRDGAAIAHALRRWSEKRAPLQPYELQYLSGWSANDA